MQMPFWGGLYYLNLDCSMSWMHRTSVSRILGFAMLTLFHWSAVYAAGEEYRISLSLNWHTSPLSVTAEDGFSARYYAGFEGASYEALGASIVPVYSANLPVSVKGTVTVTLQEAVWESIRWPGRAIPELAEAPAFRTFIGLEKGRPMLHCSFVPLRKNPSTGQLEKLVSGRLELSILPSATRMDETEHDYADHSRLQTGTWVRISVTSNGIYKIDRALLESAGISTATLNPATLGVFGYGGGMLPEANDDHNPDDVVELPLYKVGLDDGSFDDGDYVLFYGESPNQWTYNETTDAYRQYNHLYANRTSYFISPDRGTNLTLSTRNNSAESPTYTTSSYDYLQAWNNDVVNLISSGRQFFDENFTNFSNSRNYSATIPNIIAGETGRIRYFVAAKSASGSSQFTLSGNGINSTTTLPAQPESTENDYASHLQFESVFTQTASSAVNINVNYSGPSGGNGWLDNIELVFRCNLNAGSGQFRFRDSRAVGETAQYTITGAGSNLLWDVTDPRHPLIQEYSGSGTISFTVEADSLLDFILFNTADAFPSDQIQVDGTIANQDIHNVSLHPDFVIVSDAAYMAEARRLAGWHHDVNDLDTLVVSVSQVYNEFSSGTPDITAIRNMMRMFYDRAAGVEDLQPKYLLFMGDASFDYKSIQTSSEDNTNRVPTYQSYESIHQVQTFPTDDYYVCLDPGEGADMSESVNLLDLACGRFPVNSVTEANEMVDKMIHYKSTTTFGNWRNTVCFVADDEDGNTHIDDANDIADWVTTNHPLYNLNKIYLDAYQQIPGAGGERYPDVNRDLNNQIFSGALILNWTGHGNEQNWAQERILGVDDINSWTNYDKLPLFITATCSFSRFDNPERTSAGELILLNAGGGGIGLVTTVRIVYSYQNYVLNSNFFYKIFEPVGGVMPTIGEALMAGKNTASDGFSAVNNRKFLLLGDPALTLNYAKYDVVTTKVNDTPISDGTDTLKALARVTIEGEIRSGGSLLSGFNGVVYPTVYDKPVSVTTLENDPEGSNPYTFSQQKSLIYKGKASVVNGAFSFEFIVPKDISYTFGNGKLSYYADNGLEDAAGYEFNVVVGGAADGALEDAEGPDVEVYMNDESFVFGGMTDENPVLYLKLLDESGINTVGNGIGHDITATVNESSEEYRLNDYYEADLDSYQSGTVRYPLYDLPAGRHAVNVKAWDVYNNSGDGYTEFVVAESAELALDHVLNYPNPFTTYTEFWFEHNRPGDLLDVKVEIFTVSGKLVKTIMTQMATDGYRVDGIGWDGLDNFGDPIGKGVYVYKLTVQAASDRSRVSAFEKLVILR